MGLLSILPQNFATVETWMARVFLFIALFIIGPWAALVVYDILLYIFRTVTYDIPLIGGRARGKARPRAPSLTERPSGRPRRFSMARGHSPAERATGHAKADIPDARPRKIAEEKNST